MTKYAVISLAGKQYRVQEGDEFVVDKLDQPEGESMTVDQVLLLKADDKLQIGTPLVEKAKVKLEIVAQQKSKKLRVAKFKAKSRYRRVYGHRQHQSVVKVTSIK